MPQSTMTSKGQITLPIDVRRALELSAGDKVDFVPAPGGGFVLVPVRGDVRRLRGRLADRVSRPVGLQAMDDAVAAGAAITKRGRS